MGQVYDIFSEVIMRTWLNTTTGSNAFNQYKMSENLESWRVECTSVSQIKINNSKRMKKVLKKKKKGGGSGWSQFASVACNKGVVAHPKL